MKADDVLRGMAVFTHDDVELGEVEEVWVKTAQGDHVPVFQHLLYGPLQGSADLLEGQDGYLQVRNRSGWGEPNQYLYIPFSTVQHVDSMSSLTLRCTTVVAGRMQGAPAAAHSFA